MIITIGMTEKTKQRPGTKIHLSLHFLMKKIHLSPYFLMKKIHLSFHSMSTLSSPYFSQNQKRTLSLSLFELLSSLCIYIMGFCIICNKPGNELKHSLNLVSIIFLKTLVVPHKTASIVIVWPIVTVWHFQTTDTEPVSSFITTQYNHKRLF